MAFVTRPSFAFVTTALLLASSVSSAQTRDETLAALEAFHWSGYVQAQYEMHGDSVNELDGSNLLNQDRFQIRRGRLKLRYEGIEHARLSMEIDATTTGVSLKEATVSLLDTWTCWHLEAAIGLFKVPFGYETLVSSADLVFPEGSPLGRTLYPGERDLGVRLSGERDPFRFSIALVNGDPIGEKAFPGRDPNSYKDLVGRIGLATALLDVGVSGHVGTEFEPGTPAIPEEGQEAVPSENATRWRVGVDAELHHQIAGLGKLEVLAELAYAHRVATALAGEQRLGAGYVAVIQHWRDRVGIAFRAAAIDPNLRTSRFYDRQFVLTPVLLFYPVPAVRLSLAYDVVIEEGASVDNDVFTARAQLKF